MATDTSGVELTRPTDVGLKREMGLIGATWASETSIIGSGWLFAGMGAAVLAGPAAIYGWLIGGACAIVLALLHAELGGMYPVAGGTARFRAVMPASMAPTTDSATFTLAHRLSSASTSTHGAAA